MKKIRTLLILLTFVTLILPVDVKAETAEVGLTFIDVDASEAEGYSADKLLERAYSDGVMSETSMAELDKYGSDYMYKRLSTAGKNLWDGLEAVCKAGYSSTENFTKWGDYYPLGYVAYDGITMEEATNIAYYFYYSNPQYFYLNTAVIRYSTGTTKGGITMCSYDDFHTGSDRQVARGKFESKLNEWNAKVDAQAGVIDKEKKAHDLVVNNTAYVSGSKYNQSAYSNLINGKSVCAGYAKTFSLLMNHAGIETFSVTSQYHEWNVTCIGSYWFNVDCTWDDPLTSSGTQILRYNYFNRSDAKVVAGDTSAYQEHKREARWSGITPSCVKDSGATSGSIGKTPVIYKVIVAYNANGGYIDTPGTTTQKAYVVYGKTYGTLPKALRANYKFFGWYTGKTSGIKIESTTKVATTSSHTLYAKWKKISLSKSTISRIRPVRTGVCKLVINAVTDAEGYEVEYSRLSDFSKPKIKNSTSRTPTITGLVAGKAYYFRVRAYATDSTGKKLYGDYSESMKYVAE